MPRSSPSGEICPSDQLGTWIFLSAELFFLCAELIRLSVGLSFLCVGLIRPSVGLQDLSAGLLFSHSASIGTFQAFGVRR